ncbi:MULTISPECIES: FeoA family protein [Streptomyces]|uniref:Ferrous iron transport protein A n=1 Tax=Streptomyces xinghaiensis TaxID=1038928 RepID=A0A3R7HBE4_9ACTN|nr:MULTISPECIES: FeoA family protein [Streptomyces]MCC3655702.1 ferrous iron transport protein A [Streptomyces sp. S07_1.15]MCC9743076.1 ferrous iron transport protein A [Streptomyces sp. MNU89]PQM21683.1 ferrous iron transport protein A [Streptomyces xinghaiensis]RKM93116.1 ferrous iron transport protein A [Streptomyces xinghaiensis]RNC71287.1 ferrous iron transport protein A [Streptomyces xinghaiensis]
MTLYEWRTSEPVRLRRIAADRELRLRLLELGFVPGTELRVLARGLAGGLVVAHGDTRTALDNRTAAALVVHGAPE